MYHELIYHLDLCILSYHQYTQSLIWPFDPYYEKFTNTFADRRKIFMEEVHSQFIGRNLYRGPGSNCGWSSNAKLDPVMVRYDQFSPWDKAYCRPEPNSWLLYNVPEYITNKIASVYISYFTPNGNITIDKVNDRPANFGPAATDHLYNFEGGTGSVSGTAAAWSSLGCILDRETVNGYDVHIVFRGSRSGSGVRAMGQGMVGKGNPDWVTDMDFNTVVQDNLFSRHGSVCRGFSTSIKTCMGTIVAALEAIQARRGKAPENIYVTGHSLGGALATLFSAAINVGHSIGPDGSKLPQSIKNWPWKKLQLISYSAPVVGGKSFHKEFNAKVYARRVVLSKDPITQEKRHYHVGAEVYVTGKNLQSPLSYHEPMNVRERLYRKLAQWGDSLTNVVAPNITDQDFPWKVFKSFDALVSNALTNNIANIRSTLNLSLDDIDHYFEIYKRIVTNPKIYKYSVKAQNESKHFELESAQIFLKCLKSKTDKKVALSMLQGHLIGIRGAFGGIAEHICFLLVLATILNVPDIDRTKVAALLQECKQ